MPIAALAAVSTAIKPTEVNLAALVGIEDVRPAVAGQRLLQRFDAKVRGQRDRRPPGEDSAAVPVDGDREIAGEAR